MTTGADCIQFTPFHLDPQPAGPRIERVTGHLLPSVAAIGVAMVVVVVVVVATTTAAAGLSSPRAGRPTKVASERMELRAAARGRALAALAAADEGPSK